MMDVTLKNQVNPLITKIKVQTIVAIFVAAQVLRRNRDAITTTVGNQKALIKFLCFAVFVF